MPNVLSSPSHKAQIGYNGFDMSNLLKFSSTTGELLPVYFDLLYPGDKVDCSSILKTRLMPIEAAAMCNIEEHIDWFFVPLNQIWSLFSNWFYQINDLTSSLFVSDNLSNNLRDTFPYIPGVAMGAAYNELVNEQDKYFAPVSFAEHAFKGTSLRLMELLNIPLPNNIDLDDNPEMHWMMAFNPMFACAYQKIYFDYYRLSDREPNDPEAYNLDNLSALDTEPGTFLIKKYFTLRYRPRRKDFFTHTYVSPLFAMAGMNAYPTGMPEVAYSGLVDSFQQWLTPVRLATYSPTSVGASEAGGVPQANPTEPTVVGPSTVNANTSIVSHLTPTAIRTSFAVQKLLEITRRAGKHIDDQTLAHFGVKIDRKLSGEVLFLGGSSSTIQIGDVIATATTGQEGVPGSGSALGQVGGKGYGFNKSDSIRFTNDYPCPGILMAIYSAAPAMDYKQTGYDRMNTKIYLEDFRRPEFDNLGMQPQFSYQRYANMIDESAGAAFLNEVVGWQFRWLEEKLKYNRVAGSLARSLNYWTTVYDSFYHVPTGSSDDNALTFYLVSPFDLNDILLQGYNFDPTEVGQSISCLGPGQTNTSTLFGADPLLHELYFDVKKASKMSSFGLESL